MLYGCDRIWQYLHAELMLLGFISLLLTVFQRTISRICVSRRFFGHMLPCKETSFSPNQEVHHAKGLKLQLTWNNQKLLSEDEGSDTCMSQMVLVAFCSLIPLAECE
ncbi:hypothetical protein B296_00019472 [Ensete ventricosum]|uniref:Uncharacterized protein n=1 Tax=Ensete ventricosum TaxID=4639 RepID=A0A426Z4X8_ENSVE|nr:hypothetical protein B296_00019472 [Ensete ventricosum]